MKTKFSTIFRKQVGRFAAFAAFILPTCWALAQGAPPAPATEYSSYDVSSQLTLGPTVNVQQLSNAPSQQAPNNGAELAPFRFPRLNPPVQDEGPATDIAQNTPLDTSIGGHSFFRGFTGITQKDSRY